MKFETVKTLDDEKFHRLTGVKRPIFDKMVGILQRFPLADFSSVSKVFLS